MARPALTSVDRARGALLGLAAPRRCVRPHRRGAPGRRPWPGSWPRSCAEPQVDLHRLAHRWLEWWRHDGEGLAQATADALAFLAAHDAPPPAEGATPDPAPLTRCLPLAWPWRTPRATWSAAPTTS